MEHFVEIGAVHQVGCTTKIFDGSLFAESACGAEHGYALGRLERQAGRHNFAPDGGHMLALEGALVGGLDLLDHLGHPVRAEEGGAFSLLDFADLLGHAGALVQQREQLAVEGVDLRAQIAKGDVRGKRGVRAHGCVGEGVQACCFSNSCM